MMIDPLPEIDTDTGEVSIPDNRTIDGMYLILL